MGLLALLVTLIVAGIIFYVLWWALGAIALPEPFNKVATVILILAAVIVLIGIFTGGITFPVFTQYIR